MKECIEISCSNEATFRGRCKPCQAIFRKEYRSRPHVKKQEQKYQARDDVKKRHSECSKKRRRNTETGDILRSKDRAYEQQPKVKAARREKALIKRNTLEWKSKVKEYKRKPYIKAMYSGFASKRRAVKMKATPLWLNKEKIRDIYYKCEWLNVITKGFSGKGKFQSWNVDHIVPLVNDFVCGLHCEDNLDVITASDNRKKSNIFVI